MSGKTEEARIDSRKNIARLLVVILSCLLQVGQVIGIAVYLTDYYAIISVALSTMAMLLIFRIFSRDLNAAQKISWIVLVSLFPVWGVCIYLMFGSIGVGKRVSKKFAVVEKAYETMLPQEQETFLKLEKTDKALANQAYYFRNSAGYPVYQNTDVDFYGDTVKALEAQKNAMQAAKKFIFIEYFAVEDATVWKGIEEILAEKAAEGLDVRVLYDDMGSIGGINSEAFEERLKKKRIQCKAFNRLVPVANIVMNHRDHRKITVVDGKIGFTGGYNLANEYFNLVQPYGTWKDSGVRLSGDAVRSLTLTFLKLWNSGQKKPEDPVPFLLKPEYRSAEGGFVIPYADSPVDDERVGENAYLNLIKNAKHYLYITTPYLIISDEMHRELTLAAKRGVDIRIITPGIPDKKIIFRVTRSYYAGLASEGVRIYEFTPGFIHSKQMVCDDEAAIVGTINMDYRSLYLHFEDACWFAHCRAVLSVRRDFEMLFPVCTEVTEQYSGKRGIRFTGLDCILRLLGPLL